MTFDILAPIINMYCRTKKQFICVDNSGEIIVLAELEKTGLTMEMKMKLNIN